MKTSKKLMLVGKTFAGKTTLIQYLTDRPLDYKKTQALEIIDSLMIDTPGEFLEQRGFSGALMVTSVEADVVVMLQAANEEQTMFPPAFSTLFTKPVVGIVSKIDISSETQISKAVQDLFTAGAQKVFPVSITKNIGFEQFLEYLNSL